MRIRTIKPEFFVHEGLAELDVATRLAFVGLWCVADREGRFEWRPKRLKIQIMPWDDVDFSAILEELIAHDFIRKYQIDNKIYAYIPSFPQHQRINMREAQSTLPAPTKQVESGERTCVHVQAHGEGKGKEGVYNVHFLSFWDSYPRKKGKGAAWKSWVKEGCDSITQQILKSVESHKAEWKTTDPKYIPHPSTFLNQRRWEDEVESKESPTLQRLKRELAELKSKENPEEKDLWRIETLEQEIQLESI